MTTPTKGQQSCQDNSHAGATVTQRRQSCSDYVHNGITVMKGKKSWLEMFFVRDNYRARKGSSNNRLCSPRSMEVFKRIYTSHCFNTVFRKKHNPWISRIWVNNISFCRGMLENGRNDRGSLLIIAKKSYSTWNPTWENFDIFPERLNAFYTLSSSLSAKELPKACPCYLVHFLWSIVITRILLQRLKIWSSWKSSDVLKIILSAIR